MGLSARARTDGSAPVKRQYDLMIVWKKFPLFTYCIHGCTNVHSVHDLTPLFHSPAGSGSVGCGCGLVVSHRHQCIHAVDRHVPSSKRHSGLPPPSRSPCVHDASTAVAPVSWLHSDMSRYFPRNPMSKDTKNAGIAYLLSVVIVVAVASLPSIAL